MQKVSIDIGLDSPISALVVRPASGMGPIVLIVHDIFGLSPYMINQAKHLAAKGYLAVCPDLLQAHEPLSERNTADADPARKAWAKLDLARCLETLKAVTAHLYKSAPHDRLAALGYGEGGGLAVELLIDGAVDAAIVISGNGIEDAIPELEKLDRPLLMHFGEDDRQIMPVARDDLRRTARENGAISAHFYPCLGHQFTCPGTIDFNADATELANERTMRFLKRELN